jgi:hypothetical protein
MGSTSFRLITIEAWVSMQCRTTLFSLSVSSAGQGFFRSPAPVMVMPRGTDRCETPTKVIPVRLFDFITTTFHVFTSNLEDHRAENKKAKRPCNFENAVSQHADARLTLCFVVGLPVE